VADARIIFENAAVLDVDGGRLIPEQRVVIEGERIAGVHTMQQPFTVRDGDTVLDVAGKTLMPGLCDAHVHVTAWTANLPELTRSSPQYSAARAVGILEGMLQRGFTTVRDEGGADYGLARAVDEGHVKGPRILYCGPALSPTGGHGDMRGPGEHVLQGLSLTGGLGRLCDGVAEVRRACRDEIRRGARHIKLMLSGGVASPTDRIDNLQFGADEVRAAVEEAEMAGLYVTGHVYTARAINRALELGVRSLEHCNLLDDSSIELFLKHGAFMVPTLATYQALAREGVANGLPAEVAGKLDQVLDAGLRALETAHRAGVRLVYGTDLLGAMHRHQLSEFALRAQVQPPADVIRAATCGAAELFREVGEIGVVAPGARADLLVVDGDPLSDLGCLQQPERCLQLIMKAGACYKNILGVMSDER
jgi:imidazolonepropionase-like amidohydrolase